MPTTFTQAFARLRRSRAAKIGLTLIIVAQPILGVWIARAPLMQAATAVHDVAPLVATYLRLKAEGKV